MRVSLFIIRAVSTTDAARLFFLNIEKEAKSLQESKKVRTFAP